jgi:hypothetical protein
LVGEHALIAAGEKEFAAEFPGAGSEINDMIGGANGVWIVFDDQDGVAEIAERLEDVDEPLRVARVEANGGFVQNIQRPD